MVWSASRGSSLSPSDAIAITCADCCLNPLDVGDVLLVAQHRPGSSRSQVAMITTGRFSSIIALGPCLVSPVG